MNQLFQSELRRNIINSSAFIYHPFVCALKSSRTTNKYEFLSVIESTLSWELSAKNSNLSLNSLGDPYKEIKLHVLPAISILKLIHSCNN